MNLGHIIERNAELFPEEPALVFEEQVTTHRQFRQRVTGLINGLAALGLSRQDRFAILSQNRPEYLECYGAAELGGFVCVGLNWRLSTAEQLDILRDCTPKAVVFEAQYEERVASLQSRLPPGTIFICIGPVPDWAISYNELVSSSAADVPLLRADSGDIAYLIYTSGSTGRPKGVMLENGAQYRQAQALALAHAARQSDRLEVVMPLFHIGGLAEHHSYSFGGATAYLHRGFDADVLLDAIERHRSTALHLAPIMIQRVLDALERRSCDLSSLRTIIYASAPMPVRLLERAIERFGRVFTQVYGMTEGMISVLDAHRHVLDGTALDAGRLASAGQRCFGVQVKIVDENGQSQPAEQVGEICVKSDMLFKGYWQAPDATKTAFVDDWFHTGDIGYLDTENYVFVVDRKKDMIVSGGENIYSREVEEAILRHPAVREVAVIGVPDEKWGESVKAFVALESGCSASESEIVDHCRAYIASYKKPRSVEFVDALPRKASTDKVDKMELRKRFWSTQDRMVS